MSNYIYFIRNSETSNATEVVRELRVRQRDAEKIISKCVDVSYKKYYYIFDDVELGTTISPFYSGFYSFGDEEYKEMEKFIEIHKIDYVVLAESLEEKIYLEENIK